MSSVIRVFRRACVMLAATCLALATAVMLTGCGEQRAVEDAEAAIRDGMDADMATLTSLDSTTATTLFSSDFTSQLVSAGIDPVDVYGPLFSGLSYSVDSIDVSIDDGTATVHVTVTNKDLATAFANYQSRLTEALTNSETYAEVAAIADDEAALTSYLVDMLVECVSDSALGTVTTEVDVAYTLVDDAWVADDLSELEKALLGGLDADALATEAA